MARIKPISPYPSIRIANNEEDLPGFSNDILREFTELREALTSILSDRTFGELTAHTDDTDVLDLIQKNTGATAGAHIQFDDKAGNPPAPVTGSLWRSGDRLQFRQAAATVDLAMGGGGTKHTITINSPADTADDVDFDDALPAAGAGDLNVKWQSVGDTPTSISAYIDASALEPLLTHANLAGVGGNEDDHDEYIRHSGVRAFTGDQSMGGNDLTGLGTVQGTGTLSMKDGTGAQSLLLTSSQLVFRIQSKSLITLTHSSNRTSWNVAEGRIFRFTFTSSDINVGGETTWAFRSTNTKTSADYFTIENNALPMLTIDYSGRTTLKHLANTFSAEHHATDFDATALFTVDTTYSPQRFHRFRIPAMSIDSAKTVALATTVYIEGAPTNAGAGTLTAALSLHVDAGKTQLDGDVEIDGALKHDGSTVGFYNTIPVAQSAAYTVTGESGTDRTINVDSTTVNELADVVGNLIEDLKLTGIIQ